MRMSLISYWLADHFFVLAPLELGLLTHMISRVKHSFLLLLVILFHGCGNSRSMKDPEANLSTYRFVTIYNSTEASFIELELEGVFRELGLKPIGDNEVDKLQKGECFGVRYVVGGQMGDSYSATLLLEDAITDKTLVTCNASTSWRAFNSPNREWVKKKIIEELRKALKLSKE